MVKMIDNYTLVQVIGEGMYGKVYRAKNLKNNQDYAIKLIPSQKLHENAKLQQCTMNEVQTLTLIGQTDHIIMYYEMLKTKNNYYFVYEFCNGGTLMDILKKSHHLPEDKALDIFKQLLDAFKVLNRLNIMHRDLKPENIFFSNDTVKLGDFGFCKGLRPQENLTRTMLGSPIYMAPEVLKGQAYSTKADIWSLGVILYQMLYGVCPYQSNSIAMLINTINSHQIQLPSNVVVSEKTQKLIKKLLTKDYFRRIGWIQLFSWFQQNEEENNSKEKILLTDKNDSRSPKTPLNQKSSMIQEWNSKTKLSELIGKDRSVSQDITRKDIKTKFNVGSLHDISPTNHLKNKTVPYTPKYEQQTEENPKTTAEKDSSNISNNYHHSYSAIRQNNLTSSPFQGYHKPSSLPKRDNTPVHNERNANYKVDSSKKIFYSHNYQNIFSTPIAQKTKKKENQQNINAESSFIAQSMNEDKEVQGKTNLQKKFRPPQYSQLNSQTPNGRKSLKSSLRVKRKELLGIHEECLEVLKETYDYLERNEENGLRIGYFVLTKTWENLKMIADNSRLDIQLLDVASLVKFEVTEVSRMVSELKQQIEDFSLTVPENAEDINDQLQELFLQDKKYPKVTQLLRDGLRAINVTEETKEPKQNLLENISIVEMVQKTKEESKPKEDSINNESFSSDYRMSRGQYHTTNSFAEYYKNLMESREKHSTSKISMHS